MVRCMAISWQMSNLRMTRVRPTIHNSINCWISNSFQQYYEEDRGFLIVWWWSWFMQGIKCSVLWRESQQTEHLANLWISMKEFSNIYFVTKSILFLLKNFFMFRNVYLAAVGDEIGRVLLLSFTFTVQGQQQPSLTLLKMLNQSEAHSSTISRLRLIHCKSLNFQFDVKVKIQFQISTAIRWRCENHRQFERK